MSGEVISLFTTPSLGNQEVLGRLEGVLAIFEAIHEGELLVAVPECDLAQHQHKVALSLLSLAHRELYAVCSEMRT